MDLDTTRPFRGSDAVRRGGLTRGRLAGPGFRRLGFDTSVAADVTDTPLLAVRTALTRAGSDAVATGWSACLALGLDVARGTPPVEIALPDRQLSRGPRLVTPPGARGVRRVARVAALLDPRPDSPPETRARVAVVLAGPPRPQVRFELRDARGTLRHELDLAWPEFLVALEYDGHDHTQSDRRGRDLDRLDALRREGWLVIVVTALQLRRPGPGSRPRP